jgi:uncharacterized protein YlxW (UPF0749 family)
VNPVDIDTRVGKLEQDAARLQQRVEDLSNTMRTFAPMVVTMTRLEESVKGLHDDVSACTTSVSQIRNAIDDRERRYSQERRSLRIALIGLSGVIFAALISAAGTLLASGVLG